MARGRVLGMARAALLALAGSLATWTPACNGRVMFDLMGCDQDDECPLANLHCDVASKTCVACTADAHCVALGNGLGRCDTALHSCVECGLDADCGTGRACRSRHCVTLCQGEGDSASCPRATPHCEDPPGFCILCEEDNDACVTASAPGPLCHMATGLCMSCLSNANCGGTNPRCDTITGRCVECLVSADCRGATSACDPKSSRCVPAR